MTGGNEYGTILFWAGKEFSTNSNFSEYKSTNFVAMWYPIISYLSDFEYLPINQNYKEMLFKESIEILNIYFFLLDYLRYSTIV